MKLTTSRSKTYDVDWIDGPTCTTGRVMLHMTDERRLPEIAGEFDGLEWLKRESEEQGNKEWNGFSLLEHISRNGSTVTIALSKEN